MKTLQWPLLMAALAVFVNLVMLAKMPDDVPVRFADLPEPQCERPPDGHCDDEPVPETEEREEMISALGFKTRPSLQVAMAEHED